MQAHLRPLNRATPNLIADGQRPRRRRPPLLLPLLAGLLAGASVLAVGLLPLTWGALLLIALVGGCAAVLTGQPRRVLLAVCILDTPLEWDKYLGFQEQWGNLGAIGGFSISLTTLCLLILSLLWLIEWLHKRDVRYQSWLHPLAPLLLYVGFVALSVMKAIDPVFSLHELWILAQTAWLFAYVVAHTQTRSDLNFLITIVMGGLILESCIAIGGVLAGIQEISIAGFRVDVYYGRAAGTLGSPNTLSSYLVPPLLIALGVLLGNKGQRVVASVAMLLGSAALVLTQSRGGWLAGGIALLIFGTLALRHGWISSRTVMVGVVVATVIGTVLGGTVIERLTGVDGGSAMARLPLMRLAWAMIADNIFLGVGANQFALRSADYLTGSLGDAWLNTVHNKYLLVWAENGIGGVLAFVWMLNVLLRRAWRGMQSTDLDHAKISLALFAAVCGQAIHMLFDVYHSRPQVQAFWLLAAVVTIVEMQRHLQENEEGI